MCALFGYLIQSRGGTFPTGGRVGSLSDIFAWMHGLSLEKERGSDYGFSERSNSG